jgi:hypothetical protein
MEKQPVKVSDFYFVPFELRVLYLFWCYHFQVININDNLKSMLSELYESDCIFDKFEASANAAGDRIVTGSYG